ALPDNAECVNTGTGEYTFTVALDATSEYCTYGTLSCICYNGSVMSVESFIYCGTAVSEENIRSAAEAFTDVANGYFDYDGEKIEALCVESYRLAYIIDSKGFLQPEYEFVCTVNGSKPVLLTAGALYR
ncbi:MAG TPA: hypothetical protein PLT66_00225, partial [Bacillota bacterium]|nr:hypothetical protein [Bacillota bacterium]